MLLRDIKFAKNIARSIYNYASRREECFSLPSIFWIEPTNSCNLRCIMCPSTYFGEKIKKGFMKVELFKKIIDEISPFTLDSFLSLSGEPLLHKDISLMVEYMIKKGVRPFINTNGTLLTKKMSHDLIKAGLDFITFSFDGYDRDTYEWVRVGANFDETIQNIRSFLEAKKELGRKKLYVEIQTLVNRNEDEKFSSSKKKEFQSCFKDLTPNKFSMVLVSNLAKSMPETVIYSIPNAKQIIPEDRESPEFVRDFHPCPAPWTTMTIQWDGTVVPCCQDFFAEYPLGNINNQTIVEIWNGKPMRSLRKKMVNKEIHDIKLCAQCRVPFCRTIYGIPNIFHGPPSLIKKWLGYRNYRFLKELIWRERS